MNVLYTLKSKMLWTFSKRSTPAIHPEHIGKEAPAWACSSRKTLSSNIKVRLHRKRCCADGVRSAIAWRGRTRAVPDGRQSQRATVNWEYMMQWGGCDMDVDIRWKQRFQNFEQAFKSLEAALSKQELSELERAGVIQIYEFTFELAWKTLKDYLEDRQVVVKYPRDTIKEAFRYELLEDGDLWLDMLQKRTLIAHTYDMKLAELAYSLIAGSYYSALKQVYEKLGTQA